MPRPPVTPELRLHQLRQLQQHDLARYASFGPREYEATAKELLRRLDNRIAKQAAAGQLPQDAAPVTHELDRADLTTHLRSWWPDLTYRADDDPEES